MTDTFLDVFSKKNKRQCTSLVLLAEAKKALTLGKSRSSSAMQSKKTRMWHH
jgi:hypothetical protein